MNPSDSDADKILGEILVKVRETRNRRRARRIAASCALLLLACLALVLRPMPAERTERGVSKIIVKPPAFSPPPPDPEPSPAITLAVLVFQDGVPCLEEVDTGSLGNQELDFSLAPVRAFPEGSGIERWR